MTLAPAQKARRRIRDGRPCPECKSESCRSVSSFACWGRAFREVLHRHGYGRCGAHSRMLRDAGIDIQVAPQPQGNEVVYAPMWAILQLGAIRTAHKQSGKRLSGAQVQTQLRLDPRYREPVPGAMTTRMVELRAFAVLRGWRCERSQWYR